MNGDTKLDSENNDKSADTADENNGYVYLFNLSLINSFEDQNPNFEEVQTENKVKILIIVLNNFILFNFLFLFQIKL